MKSVDFMIRAAVYATLITCFTVKNTNATPIFIKPTPTINDNEQQARAFEGDMILPPSQTGRALVALGSSVPWPNGIVPYEISSEYADAQQTAIITGMQKLETYTAINDYRCIQFRPKVVSDQYYIFIFNGTGCYSYVGMNANFGPSLNRTVSLQHPGCTDNGRIMHELMHALGLYHEQSRPDRDSYVQVNTANIIAGTENNFQKYNTSQSSTLNSSYDYSSVMHFAKTTFSSNGLPTIEPLQSNVKIGQRYKLTPADIAAIRNFYNCTGSGGTLLSTTTTTTSVTPSVTSSTYYSQLTTNNPTYIRVNGTEGPFLYELIRVEIPTAGYYTFICDSEIDTFASAYQSSFNATNVLSNLLGFVDDTNTDNWEFSFTIQSITAGFFLLVVSTYSPNVVGPFSISGTGPAAPTFIQQGVPTSTTTATTTTATATESTTTPILTSVLTAYYSSALTPNHPNFTRYGGKAGADYYYEAFLVNVSTVGTYTLRSDSIIDSYGYLYTSSFVSTSPASNLASSNDDSGGNRQFQISYYMQPGISYYLVFTTYDVAVKGPFGVAVSGPSRATITRVSGNQSPALQNATMSRGWLNTSSMSLARHTHTMSILANGQVLVAGGFDPTSSLVSLYRSTEIYVPSTRLWTTTGDMSVVRLAPTASVLTNGKVLVAGGNMVDQNNVTATAELYDSSTGLWTRTGNLNVARQSHRASLLSNGKVLVAGGYNMYNNDSTITAELYDPVTEIWTRTGNLRVNRFVAHTTSVLSNGKVLVVGGSFDSIGCTETAELYDPSTGLWTTTGSMRYSRCFHTASVLNNGKVLVTGGTDSSNVYLSAAELYDPSTGSWTVTGNMNFRRRFHAASLLTNGKVLVTGGDDPSGVLNSTETYDPSIGIWTLDNYLNGLRTRHAQSTLTDGTVLITGGRESSYFLRSSELYIG